MWLRVFAILISSFFCFTGALLVILQGYELGGAIISFITDWFQNKTK